LLSTGIAMATNNYNLTILKSESINYEIGPYNSEDKSPTGCDQSLSLTRESLIQKVNNNEDVSNVNVSCITDFSYIFSPDRESASPSIAKLSSVDLTHLYTFNQDISNWDVSNGVNFEGMFKDSASFNKNINKWKVLNGTNFKNMFYGAEDFNQPLNDWNMENAESLEGMFREADTFNQNINSWNVRNVKVFANMFNSAYDYNQPLNDWEVSKATVFFGMFANAKKFNQPLSNWQPLEAKLMAQMFFFAEAFNQDISSWNVDSVISFENFRLFSLLSTENTPVAFR
jgi:hypothetical protein